MAQEQPRSKARGTKRLNFMIFKIFEKYLNLKYGISEKKDGSMSMAEQENRQKYFKSERFSEKNTVSAKQIHSDLVSVVKEKDAGHTMLNTDSLTTDLPGLFLAITVADCFPVYLFNPKTNQVALAHSGWRGTIKNVAGKTIKAMGGDPSDILAGIGPGIQKCHFEVKNDILNEFAGYPKAIIKEANTVFVDLPTMIKIQLQKAGVKNIESFGKCTYCESQKYFSHRCNQSNPVKLMLSYIGTIKGTN